MTTDHMSVAARLNVDQPWREHAAHPQVPRRLTEQQGGIPNDAYTADDPPKGM